MSAPLHFADAALKWSSAACVTTAIGLATWGAVSDPDSLLHRGWARYCGWLESLLYRAFVFRRGQPIAIGQLLALFGVAVVAILGKVPWTFTAMAALLVVIGPALHLQRTLRKRVEKIDMQVEGFLVAVANALKSRPAIGDAMASVVNLTPNPLRQELELVVKQMRLGTTVDQALLHMSARVGSKPLDTALTALLIGRQVGGNLPSIIETTAAAMREMARLEGVVRTKTAEGKAQMWVLAFFPLILMVTFNAASPGYFDGLTDSVAGYVAVVVAFGCWGGSLVVGRRILAVDI
ncbi:MAG: type II secretion system F family protein [Polyangiaceae bacterium]|nr:type II secretion system F family protein [Polyangiaceae bacterium]